MVKLVYIAHQISGNIDKNILDILSICREIHTNDIFPIAPYLVSLQYLNDQNPEERRLGMQLNRMYFEKRIVDETWLCGPKISKGMHEEITLSLKHGIPVICYNAKLQPELEKILENLS